MKIICIGRNYAAHINELANERPNEPILFLKPDTAVLPKKFPFVIPEFTNNVHYEVEILVKINKVGKHIEQKFAHKYYDEIGLGIDFTARDIQDQLKAKGLPWEKAKGFDGSAVIGEFLPKTAFLSMDAINFSLTKNNQTVQKSNSGLMLFKIDELIAEVSKYFTLKKGDIIFTGTPEGVAAVAPNDILEGFIDAKSMFKINVK